jgi:hypothetical protein
VVLPDDLVREIDRVAGSRGRSAFLADSGKARNQAAASFRAVAAQSGVLARRGSPRIEEWGAAAAWVRKMRAESEARLKRIQKRRNDS